LAQFNDFCDTAGIVNLSGGSPSGGIYSGTSVSNNTFNTSIGIGTYPVTYSYTNNNGCTNETTQNLTVISCAGSGIDDLLFRSFQIYPNPTRDVLFIECQEDRFDTYYIVDAFGRKVYTGQLAGKTTQLSFDNFTNGLYFIEIESLGIPIRIVKQ
jgi:hypothetical protein